RSRGDRRDSGRRWQGQQGGRGVLLNLRRRRADGRLCRRNGSRGRNGGRGSRRLARGIGWRRSRTGRRRIRSRGWRLRINFGLLGGGFARTVAVLIAMRAL